MLTRVNRYALTHPEPDSSIEAQHGSVIDGQVADLTTLLDDLRYQTDRVKADRKLTDHGKADAIGRIGKAAVAKLQELSATSRQPIDDQLKTLKLPQRLPTVSGYLNLTERTDKLNPAAVVADVEAIRAKLDAMNPIEARHTLQEAAKAKDTLVMLAAAAHPLLRPKSLSDADVNDGVRTWINTHLTAEGRAARDAISLFESNAKTAAKRISELTGVSGREGIVITGDSQPGDGE